MFTGAVQLVPIDPFGVARITVPPVTTSPAPDTSVVALLAVRLYVPPATLSTPQVVSFASVTVPAAESVAYTFCPAPLACNATVLAFIVIGVPNVPIDPPVDNIDTSFAVIPVPAVAMLPVPAPADVAAK
jgi:hypothetical protein